MIYRNRFFAWGLGFVLERLFLSVLLIFAVSLCVLSTGCKTVGVATPPAATAPTDPYATALARLRVFSQIVVDAKATAVTLHTVQLVNADGSTWTVLDDATYAKVSAGLNALAVEGTKLSNLLAARKSSAEISAQMAVLTGVLASQLSPEIVGIKNPVAQQKYVIITSLVSLGLNTLANYINLIPATEARNVPRSNLGFDPAPHRVGSDDPYRHRADSEGFTPFAAGRPYRAARPGQREFRQGVRLLAVRLA